MRLHPLSRSYFRPYEGIDLLASFMESLAATKELLFALVAAGYLGWGGYRRMKEREEAEDELAVLARLLDDRSTARTSTPDTSPEAPADDELLEQPPPPPAPALAMRWFPRRQPAVMMAAPLSLRGIRNPSPRASHGLPLGFSGASA